MKSFGDHYVEGEYTANYSFYDEESSDVLGHSARALYSYRPFEKLSFGTDANFFWLEDSDIAAAIGDRVLALGYSQAQPNFQVKYEITPMIVASSKVGFESLDVRDGDNDNFIDNRRYHSDVRFDFDITEDKGWGGLIGFERNQITFPHISEKASATNRGFTGLTKIFPGLAEATAEVGFSEINLEDENNADEDQIDFRISMETLFSLYTKFNMSYQMGLMTPSLRSEYTQYESDIARIALNHALGPKTTLLLNYSYEFQDFDDSDALAGQSRIDRETHIHTAGVGVNHKLKDWLTLELGYDYVKRDTDFIQEGYTNNKFGVGLTARY
jgi:hypothetical protein